MMERLCRLTGIALVCCLRSDYGSRKIKKGSGRRRRKLKAMDVVFHIAVLLPFPLQFPCHPVVMEMSREEAVELGVVGV